MSNLSRLLVVAGGVGVAGSVLWWHTFYSQVAQLLGRNVTLPTECIYTLGGPCGMVSGAASMIGAAAYDPRVFWGSVAAVVIGVILGVLPDDDRDDDHRSRPPRRQDPRL